MPIHAEASVFVPHSPEQLWPFVADTNRMDRAVGLPPAVFSYAERAEGGEQPLGEYRMLGLPLARWVEHPFEWERPLRFSIVRDYQHGPLLRFFGGTELKPVDSGTEVRVFAEFTPRSWLFDPLVRLWLAPRSIRRACRQYRAVADFLAGRSSLPFREQASARSQANAVRLRQIVERLRAEGVPEQPLTRLQRLLVEGADEDVFGMRPLELAVAWSTDPRETLSTFLRATLGGGLEMRWELLCPSCRGAKADAARLQDLPPGGHCSTCNLDFTTSLENAVEARFYPAPAIRAVSIGTYCVGGPMSTPHRIVQLVLQPGEEREWPLELAKGSYLLRSPQSRGSVRVEVARDEPSGSAELELESMAIVPDQLQLASGAVCLRLANRTAHRVTLALDDARWSSTAASPGLLMTLPAFRELFSSEALAPGVELSVGRVGLMFTDLAGSTALYERAGDARAFRLVNQHFFILRAAVEASGGAVVKTIGDAVMAAFPDGRSALASALSIQRDIRSLDTSGLADPARLVKIGVHAGACFLVTLNGQLDYFGTAVNLAARAQREALGGEVVATADVFDDAGDLLDSLGLQVEPFEVTLRGISAPVRLYRIACHQDW